MSYAFPEPIGRRGFDAAAAGFAVTVGSLSVWRRSPRSPWLRPLAAIGVVTAGASIPLAASAWPRRGLLVGSLLAAGVEVAAAGLTLRRPRLVYGSPVLLCTAWLVFASEALSGNPEWFTVPVGLTLLTLVELGRWSRRTLGLGTVTADLLVLELLGIGFLVGSALTQILTESPAYGLLAVALSGVVAAWGGYTTVRRRAMGGAGLALLAVVLMLAAPVAQQVHQFHGAALWITVAAVGTVLILVATFLEQGRARVGIAVRRLAELMEGWE